MEYMGGVIRDRDGNWIKGFMGNLYEAKDITVELYALHKAMTHENNLTPVTYNQVKL